jgi:hypothetical protein
MRIAVYRITSGTAQEVADRAQAGLLPLFRVHVKVWGTG